MVVSSYANKAGLGIEAAVLPRPSRWVGRAAAVALGLIVCLGPAVRLRQYCAEPSFWYDEAYLLVNIADKTCFELCGPLRGGQTAPPGFLLALRGLYTHCGASEWAMRLPALLASVLALGISIPLARRIAGRPGWLWAVGFCALSHHALTHGVEVKPYAVDLLATEKLIAVTKLSTPQQLAEAIPRRAKLFVFTSTNVSARPGQNAGSKPNPKSTIHPNRSKKSKAATFPSTVSRSKPGNRMFNRWAKPRRSLGVSPHC
jgi:hypothetical protein